MATSNVNIFHGALVPTGRKVPLDQYQLQVQIEGDVISEAKASVKRSKDKAWLFPDVLLLLSPEELQDVMREILLRHARTDLEKEE